MNIALTQTNRVIKMMIIRFPLLTLHVIWTTLGRNSVFPKHKLSSEPWQCSPKIWHNHLPKQEWTKGLRLINQKLQENAGVRMLPSCDPVWVSDWKHCPGIVHQVKFRTKGRGKGATVLQVKCGIGTLLHKTSIPWSTELPNDTKLTNII